MKDRIEAVLGQVVDPELRLPITDLGLVYGVAEEEPGIWQITMTMTTPACPYAQDLITEVLKKVQALKGVTKARVELVWQPPWSKDRMSESAKLKLGVF